MAEEPITLVPDDFDEVFNALTDDETLEKPEEDEPQAIDDEAVVDEADDESEEEPEDVAESEESEEEPEEAPEEEPEVAAEAPKSDEDADALARLAKLITETQQKTYEQNAKLEQKAPEPQASEEPESIYSEEEQAALQDYEKEWPDVARGESLKRRAEYRQLVDYVFNEIAQHIIPMRETVQTLSQRTHLQDLQSAVGDYDVVRDDVVNWVETQPAYLQSAYKHVIDNGTVDEVADLITRYKAETGRVQQPQQPAAARPARKKETELPATTKQAAASLAPVSSKRSVVPQGDDPNDFASAFEAFAGKL